MRNRWKLKKTAEIRQVYLYITCFECREMKWCLITTPPFHCDECTHKLNDPDYAAALVEVEQMLQAAQTIMAVQCHCPEKDGTP